MTHFLLGNFAECSSAADRQTKQDVHPDIESDYEQETTRKKKKNTSSASMKYFLFSTHPHLHLVIAQSAIVSSRSLTAFPFTGKYSPLRIPLFRLIFLFLESVQPVQSNGKTIGLPSNNGKSSFLSKSSFLNLSNGKANAAQPPNIISSSSTDAPTNGLVSPISSVYSPVDQAQPTSISPSLKRKLDDLNPEEPRKKKIYFEELQWRRCIATFTTECQC